MAGELAERQKNGEPVRGKAKEGEGEGDIRKVAVERRKRYFSGDRLDFTHPITKHSDQNAKKAAI